jgi:O-succinylbenzoic acid--CoA ligase
MIFHPDFSYNGITLNVEEWLSRLPEFTAAAAPWEQSHYAFIAQWLNEDDMIEVQSSGTTGEPITQRVSKLSMLKSAEITARYFDCPAATNALLALSSSFIAGKMMLVRAITLGWRLTAIEPSSSPLSFISEPFDFAAFTPMQLAALSKQELALLNRFRVVIIGGAAVPDALRRRLAEMNGNCYETYGMAETLSHVAVRKIGLTEVPFQALDHVMFEVDEECRLVILADHISKSTIRTQDVVELISPTSFYYRGRYDRMINSGGVKLHAEVIERKLAAIIHVPFIVLPQQDDVLGQRLVLYMEDQQPVDLSELMLRMKEVLTRYEIPKEIFRVQHLERTQSGKIKTIQK